MGHWYWFGWGLFTYWGSIAKKGNTTIFGFLGVHLVQALYHQWGRPCTLLCEQDFIWQLIARMGPHWIGWFLAGWKHIFIVTPAWRNNWNLTNIFQLGWDHQFVLFSSLWEDDLSKEDYLDITCPHFKRYYRNPCHNRKMISAWQKGCTDLRHPSLAADLADPSFFPILSPRSGLFGGAGNILKWYQHHLFQLASSTCCDQCTQNSELMQIVAILLSWTFIFPSKSLPCRFFLLFFLRISTPLLLGEGRRNHVWWAHAENIFKV